jgi:hypothetical protein
VSEQAARGTIADVYADIRRVLGVPMVVFVYRALAASPGRLERVWTALSPNFASDAMQRNAASLDPCVRGTVKPLPQAMLSGSGIDPIRLAGTLDAFDRANRLNLIGLEALLAGTPGDATADRRKALPMAPPEMLPMADVASLPPDTVALLQTMGTSIAGSERPILIPSLFRYFAHDRVLLEAIWERIGPLVADERFFQPASEVTGRARVFMQRLPYPVPRAQDSNTRTITSRFACTIPRMIVVTELLRLALRDDAKPAAEQFRD